MAIAVGVLLLFGSTPIWWIGAGLLAGGLAVGGLALRGWFVEFWADLRGERTIGPFTFSPRPLLKDAFGLAVIITVGSALMYPSLTGDPPVNADHTVHMFRAWTLNEMIFDGRFFGWSHQWFAGYPAQYLYPIGGDLWVNAFWGATFGLASFYAAYAVAIWAMFCLQGVAVYLMARRDVGRVAAVLAGLFVLGDDGAFRLGGWVFGIHWGVWPQNLAIALACLGVWQLRDVVLGDRRHSLALFGTFMGASILTHPLLMIFWAAAIPLALFAIVTTRDDISRVVATFRLAVGTIIGGLVSAFWLLPFLSARDQSEGYGVAWQNSFSLGEGLYNGSIFAGTWSTVIIIGGIVLFGWIGARRFMPTFFAAMGWLLVIGGASDLVAGFHLLEISDAFGFLQFTRFPILTKPFWFVAAAFGMVTLVRLAPRLVDEARARVFGDSDDTDEPGLRDLDSSRGTTFIRLAVMGAAVAPLLFGWVVNAKIDQFTRGVTELSERTDRGDRAALKAYLQKEAESVEGLARVGIDFGHDEHKLHDLQIGLDLPFHKIGYIPATNFHYKMEGRAPALLERLNVKWVVTPGKRLSSAHFEKLEEFGSYHLYAFKKWRPEPFTIDGEGEAELKAFEPERIVIEAAEGAAGELIVHVSDFDRWRAYRDGEPVEIRQTPHPAERSRTGFITVDLEPGTYEIAFEHQISERLAWVALFLALLAIVLLISSDSRRGFGPAIATRWRRITDLLRSLEERHSDRLVVVAAAVFAIAGIAIFLLANWTPPLVHEFDEPADEPIWDLGNELASAEVGLERGDDRKACIETLGRHQCGDDTWKHVYTTYGGFGNDVWKRCIWAHPQPNRVLAIDVEGVPGGSRIVGYYGITSTGASRRPNPVDFRVAADGMVVYQGSTKKDKELYTVDVPLSGIEEFDLKVEIEAEKTGRRHFCFLLQVVE